VTGRRGVPCRLDVYHLTTGGLTSGHRPASDVRGCQHARFSELLTSRYGNQYGAGSGVVAFSHAAMSTLVDEALPSTQYVSAPRIRQHRLYADRVREYAAEFCGTKDLRQASREQIASFIDHLAQFAARDREELLVKLNSQISAPTSTLPHSTLDK